MEVVGWEKELHVFFNKLGMENRNYVLRIKNLHDDKCKYIERVLNNVLTIPNPSKEIDQFRWKFILPSIIDVRNYWSTTPQNYDISLSSLEEKSLADSERSSHSPRFASLAAAKSFSSVVEMTKMAILSWASYGQVIEKNGNPYIHEKWTAINDYYKYFIEVE